MLCYYSDTTCTNLEINILILKKWEKILLPMIKEKLASDNKKWDITSNFLSTVNLGKQGVVYF